MFLKVDDHRTLFLQKPSVLVSLGTHFWKCKWLYLDRAGIRVKCNLLIFTIILVKSVNQIYCPFWTTHWSNRTLDQSVSWERRPSCDGGSSALLVLECQQGALGVRLRQCPKVDDRDVSERERQISWSLSYAESKKKKMIQRNFLFTKQKQLTDLEN